MAYPTLDGINLGYIQTLSVSKDSGLLFIPEVFGDSDAVETIKQIASAKIITVAGVFTENLGSIPGFELFLEELAINGDGTTTPTAQPSAIVFSDGTGTGPNNTVYVNVSNIDYTRFSGKVNYIEYTIKMQERKNT